MGSVTWGAELAEVYDETNAALFEPPVLEPMVGLLAELARGGPALEFAVGTGRVAIPLSARGIEVAGIELSQPMAERMLAKPGAVPVTIGDMTSTRVPGTFRLVYLVANTIMNVTTQEDQLAVFANAAAHLEADGYFVVDVIVPSCAGRPLGRAAGSSSSIPITSGSRPSTTPWTRSPGHTTGSRRGQLVRHSAPYRYVWPAELDLMARITGFRRRERWAGWDRAPFTSDSALQVVVFEKLP